MNVSGALDCAAQTIAVVFCFGNLLVQQVQFPVQKLRFLKFRFLPGGAKQELFKTVLCHAPAVIVLLSPSQFNGCTAPST